MSSKLLSTISKKLEKIQLRQLGFDKPLINESTRIDSMFNARIQL